MKILKFFDEIKTKTGEISKENFHTISSLSKVASFCDIENYAIYDSRVLFSLNWLLLKYGKEDVHKGVLKFFPMPNGRNRIIQDINMRTLIISHFIHRYYSENSSSIINLFYSEHEAYHTYCKLLKIISNEIWDDNKKKYPFYIEMLLFVIFEKEIIEDIKRSISLIIKK